MRQTPVLTLAGVLSLSLVPRAALAHVPLQVARRQTGDSYSVLAREPTSVSLGDHAVP
jgi:hypothetical protein